MRGVSLIALVGALSALTVSELKDALSKPDIQEWMIETRRRIHQHPEIMYEEVETSKYIKERLTELGIKYSEGWGVEVASGKGGTGVVADIGTGHSPCVALRADMDALPVHEITDVPFKSTVNGKMHACGHDTHITMLLGAAKVLKARESEIEGTVRLIFQPAEEGGGGALMMVNEGVLDIEPKVDRIFGLHNTPAKPRGVYGRAGPVMAGASFFTGAFNCKGGHAAMPHTTIDPLQPLANLIVAAQSIVSRNLNPIDAGVISITTVGASNAHNIIAEKATYGGTIRAFSTENLNMLLTKLESMADSISKAYGCRSTEFSSTKIPFLPVINDPLIYSEVAKDVRFINAEYTSTPAEVFDIEPTMGGEDFSFFLQKRPGVFFFLGSGTEAEFSAPLHAPNFKFNEDVMPEGALLLSSTAITQLERLRERQCEESGTCRI